MDYAILLILFIITVHTINYITKRAHDNRKQKLHDYMELTDYVIQVTKLYDNAYSRILECLIDDDTSKDDVLEVVMEEFGFIEVVYEGDENNECWDLILSTVDLEDDE